MSVDNLWVLAHAVSTNHTYSQIMDFSLDNGISEILAGFDGEVDNTFAAAGLVAPTINFTSAQIKACLDAVGSSNLALSASEIFTGYFQKTVQGGTRAAAATNHISAVINEGILVPRSITAANNALASISMSAVATYNGSVLPVVVTDSQTYTASSSGIIGWTLGPVQPNGVATAAQFGGVQQMTIDFGVELELASGDGEGFPTFVAVQRRQPRITFTSKNAAQIITQTATGKTGAATVVYLRNISTVGSGVIRIADGAATHIKFTIAGDYESPRTIAGSHGSSVDYAVDLIPKSTDGTDPIGISTTSAIT